MSRSIKTMMGTFLHNFNASGKLANDSNDFERDTEFFTKCMRITSLVTSLVT